MDNLPPPVQVIQGDGKSNSSLKDDDSLVDIKVNNPFAKFFNWIKDFIKKQSNITIKIPIIGIALVLSGFGVGLGSGYSWGFNAAVHKLFPDSSPILHRAITLEGVVQKSSLGQYYLKSEGATLWTLKSVKSSLNLGDYLNKEVTVKGNLTKDKNVIEVSEVILLEAAAASPSPNIPDIPDSSNTPDLADIELPKLYYGLQWESSQKRILVFTSGKRRIDVEGFHVESSQQPAFPQDFINYYIGDLKSKGFKETLNSIDPDGIMVTYSKDDSFMTFGVKNIYSGRGDNKQIAGYKAFIEHN